MGTFHQDKGELHGITVVVDTHGDETWVGRCDEVRPDGVLLLDADVHTVGGDGPSREEYLKKAAMVGVWRKHDRVLVPQEKVATVRPLGEL